MTVNKTRFQTLPFRPLPRPSRNIERVVFDLGGVLYDDAEWKRWLFGRVTRMGHEVHFEPFIRLWNCQYQRDVRCGRRDFWVALTAHLQATGLTVPQIEELLVALRAKLRHFDSRVRPFAGVRSTLHRLAAMGVEIVIVSRSPRTQWDLQQKLVQLNLSDCPARLIATADAELIDNAANYFHWLLDQLGGAATSVAFVGRESEDLAAAAGISILSIAFNHDDSAKSDIYLDQFDHLVEIAGPCYQGLLVAG